MVTEALGDTRATLMDVLDARARDGADRIAYTFLSDGEVESGSLTFGELQRRAIAVAARLTWLNARGERAMLLYPQGLEFIVAFFGCLYAGAIAVPASLPSRKRGLEALRRAAADAGAKWILSTGDLLAELSVELAADSSFGGVSYIDTEACVAVGGETLPPPSILPDEIALLQYTSGSTALPRGVAVTHANLVDNQRQSERSFGTDASTVAISWLPMFHDMGLGTVLGAAWVGCRCLIMSPQAFLQNPARWLRAISNYRATTSGGPDFSYDLCVRRISPEQRRELDLTSWRVAYNGSEPVRAATLERFADAFGPCGFHRAAFHPVYGLAEATLLVTSEPPSSPPLIQRFSASRLELGRGVPVAAGESGPALVSSGCPASGTRMAIVEPETLEKCEAGQVGEIWLQGPSVAAGYWGKGAETESTFRAITADGTGPFLRTGDLGFVQDGHLFVTGRRKDLIIIRGRNHYPQDIEASVSACHAALVPYGCAAFSIETDQGEELVIIQEVARSELRTLDAPAVVRAIRGAVSEHHALHTHAVVLLKPSTLPRTTSGKVRRKACRQAFLDNSLPAVAAWVSPLAPAPDPEAGPDTARRERSARAERLIEWLRRHAADLINAHAAGERVSPVSLLRDFGKQGLLGMQVELEYGGLGLGNADAARVLEQLAAIDFALALFVGLNNYLGIQPIAKFARPQAKALLLPGLAHGQELAAFAFEEPTARTPLGGVTVQAQADGEDSWKLFGTKYLDGVSHGASVINVFAHHDEPPGISAFVIAEGVDGLRQVRDGLSMGLLGFARDTIALDGVKVGRENLLGSLGSGIDIAREAIMHTRLAIGAACIGGMKRCAQLVSRDGPYYGTINGKLTPNPVTLSRLGSVTASITALECLVHRSANALDAGYSVPPEAFAACKILGPELLLRCIDDLMQLSVGGSYAETNRLSSLHRDAGLIRNFDGPPEALAELTGAVVMEGDASLRRLVEEVLHAPEAVRWIDTAVDTVRQRMTNLSGALATRAQRWGHTRAGELSSWLVLLAAVEGTRRATPSAELERAHAWAHAQFQHALSAVRFGTPSETATLDTSDIAATFAAYALTIGEPQPDATSLEPGDSARQYPSAPTPPASISGSNDAPRTREPLIRELRSWIISWLARRLQMAVSQIETGRSFADHGLDSMAAVELAKALSDKLGRKLDETLLWNFSTIDALVEQLVGPAPATSVGPAPEPGPEPRRAATTQPVESALADEIARLEQELRSRS